MDFRMAACIVLLQLLSRLYFCNSVPIGSRKYVAPRWQCTCSAAAPLRLGSNVLLSESQSEHRETATPAVCLGSRRNGGSSLKLLMFGSLSMCFADFSSWSSLYGHKAFPFCLCHRNSTPINSPNCFAFRNVCKLDATSAIQAPETEGTDTT
jgi:hypothetical protein